jgi:DNA-3-methyladenine glycosylase I
MTASKQPKIDRCPWPGIADPIYAAYHDTEWGVPLTDNQKLFEKICLEGFQAGLSWLTILRKREAFRKAFRNFDPNAIARLTAKDVDRLMTNTGIIRSRPKIEATIRNAQAYLEISERQSFASFIWNQIDRPQQNALQALKDAAAQTEASQTLSSNLKKAGFSFVGPTTAYAFMQSSGMVNDHLVSCPRHGPCAKLQRALKLPLP